MENTGILVGYDGSPAADVGAAWAARAARLRDEPVTALIVMDPADMPHGRPWPEPWWRDIEDRARESLRDCGHALVRVERREGPTTSTLLEAAEHSSMLVLGSAGHSRLAEHLLHSVSQGAARRTRVPLVVARPVSDPTARRVTVGVDGSEASTRAVAFACDFAERAHDALDLLTGWRSGDAPPGAHGAGLLLATKSHRQQAMLDTVAAQTREAHPALTTAAELVHRDPGRALVDASATSELVVVGCQGLTALEEVVLGSVSQHVLRHAHCPVAVVH